jgi:hypothetical protein
MVVRDLQVGTIPWESCFLVHDDACFTKRQPTYNNDTAFRPRIGSPIGFHLFETMDEESCRGNCER